MLKTSNQSEDYDQTYRNWRRCWFSSSQKQAYCFDVDSSHGVDQIPELNCVPDPFKAIPVIEIDQAAEEAMDRYVKKSMVVSK